MSIDAISSQGQSVSARFAAAGYTFTPQNKDRDGDGNISREEFKMPTLPGTTECTLIPADFSAAPSLDQTFDAYDRNHDGSIDAAEAEAQPVFSGFKRPADRFTVNWGEHMTTQQALAYFNQVDKDNAETLRSWGIDL